MSTENNDPVVRIGDIEVPEWQFQIYTNESDKFLGVLESEFKDAKHSPIGKNLIRAVHTLSGTTNTLGIDLVARLGHPFEYWLTHLMDQHADQVVDENHYIVIESTCMAITTLVRSIQAKEYPIFEYEDLQQHLNECMQAILKEQEEGTSEINDISAEKQDDIASLLSFENDDIGDFGDLDSLLGDLGSSLPVAKAPVEASKTPQINTTAKPAITTSTTPKVASTSRYSQSDIASLIPGMLPDDTVVDEVDDSIKDIFLEEAVDIFDELPQTIEQWMLSAGEDVEYANLIKRALHTLKGSARMAGYIRFGHLVHNIETAMDTGWPGLHQSDLPELIQLTCDALAQETEHLKNSNKPSGFTQLRTYTNRNSTTTMITAPLEQVAVVTPVVDKPMSVVELPVQAPVHIPSLPTVNLPSGPTATQVDLPLDFGNDAVDIDLSLPMGYKDIMTEHAEAIDEDSVAGVLRVPTAKIDVLANQLGKNGMIQLKIESSVDKVEQHIQEMSLNLDRLRRLLKDVEIQAETQMKSRMNDAQQSGATFDPLEFDRFSRLQELTRMTAEAMNDINNSQHEMLRGLVDVQDSMAETNIVADDMQHAVMSVRTVPVSSMKRRLDRLVRQACRDTNKQADLVLSNELDIDSGVLNKVIAPLEHLVRNAIAHGIETPAKRIELGKPEVGTITLAVLSRGNDIVFRMTDDGSGINREAVQRKAREKNMIGATEEITQERANMLIFDAGFSTAENISTLAGRGVGMDVVQGDIAAMGGRINVHSETNKGTLFELVVPSYMSVISMVPVRSNKVTYAVPATLIQDVIVVRDNLVLSAYESGVLQAQGVEYPFYGLAEVSGEGYNDIERNNRVLIVTDNNESVAVHIDTLDADRNLIMKPLCRTIATLPGLMGSTVSGDGTPLLVINPVYLRASVQRREATQAVAQVFEVKAKTRADITVMVVDDSLTVRRITQKFLDREGFKSIVAKDGLDAIEKITQHGCPDLFLCDIEMPNMDGFQLVEHIRTAVSKTVPIIMISSRSIEKYSDHAKSLGVNKSLGKPYQEHELLELIAEFTELQS